MLDIIVRPNTDELRKLTQNLSKNQIAKAANSAINKSIITGRSEMRKEIRKKYNIISSQLADRVMPVKRSNPTTLTAKVEASRIPISLTNFSPIFNFKKGSVSIKRSSKAVDKRFSGRRNRKGGDGLTVEIMKGKRESIPFAFIVKNDSMKPVFARGNYEGSGGNYAFITRNKRVNSSGSDTPITKLKTTSVFGASQNTDVVKHVNASMVTKYQVSMASYIKGLLK